MAPILTSRCKFKVRCAIKACILTIPLHSATPDSAAIPLFLPPAIYGPYSSTQEVLLSCTSITSLDVLTGSSWRFPPPYIEYSFPVSRSEVMTSLPSFLPSDFLGPQPME
eukprot:755479-Hanusia_phi.AAC.5